MTIRIVYKPLSSTSPSSSSPLSFGQQFDLNTDKLLDEKSDNKDNKKMKRILFWLFSLIIVIGIIVSFVSSLKIDHSHRNGKYNLDLFLDKFFTEHQFIYVLMFETDQTLYQHRLFRQNHMQVVNIKFRLKSNYMVCYKEFFLSFEYYFIFNIEFFFIKSLVCINRLDRLY